MGAVGGLLGIGGGSGGTGFNANQSGTNPQQLQTAYTNANNAVANQNQVYNQFQNIAAGQGPNPAQAMLNQATGQNVAQQGALQAGQRGAAQNVGLLARQAGQQGMQAQQQAAGQGASMQAQQALGALGQAGQMATGITAAQQGEQGILQGANSANQNIQGQLANTTMQGQQGLLGGVGNAFGAITHLFAEGGNVQKMAEGGDMGPRSMFAQFINQAQPGNMPQFGSSNSGASALAAIGKNKKPQAVSNPMVGSTNAVSNASGVPGGNQSAGIGNIPTNGGFINPDETDQTFVQAATGGEVKALVSPGEHRVPKEKVSDVAKGKVNPLKVGETFPGKPKVKGNSYSNDTIPKKLPEGDIIIPNDVMQSDDPVRGAAEFVRDVLSKKGKRK